MTREEIQERIRELQASLDAGPATDPLHSYSENLALSAERLRELTRLQALLRKTEEPR